MGKSSQIPADSLDDWITYPYVEDGQDFTVVQPKAWPKKDDLREDGAFNNMNRNGRFAIPINRFRDVVLVPSITAEMFMQQRKEIRFRPGDITIATYPRSGTTWTEQIVCLLLNRGNPGDLNTREKNAYDPAHPNRIGKVFLDGLYHKNCTGNIAAPWGISLGKDRPMKAKDLDKIPFRRVFKSHHRAHMLIGAGEATEHLDREEPPPIETENVKFIWVIRDPKDAALSMMRINTTDYTKHGVPLTAFMKVFLEGKANRGSWVDHAREWLAFSKQRPDIILPLSYEENKKDPKGTARKIARFLDLDLTEEELDNSVHYSSFESMKEMSKDADAPHVLRGKVAGWRERMSDEMIEAFNEMASDPRLGELSGKYVYNLETQNK